jgi:hypothetical protein
MVDITHTMLKKIENLFNLCNQYPILFFSTQKMVFYLIKMGWIPSPNKINYPVSLGVYQTSDHLMFVFGDIHDTYKSKLCLDCDNTQECMTIDFWIRELVEQAPQCVDVFIEDSPSWVVAKSIKQTEKERDYLEFHRKHELVKTIPKTRGSINYVRESFRHCYGKRCHSNVRFHATDVRLSGFNKHDKDLIDKIHKKYQALRNVEEARIQYKKDVTSIIRGKYNHTLFKKLSKQLKILKSQNKQKWAKVIGILDEYPDSLQSKGNWNDLQTDNSFHFVGILFYRLIDVYMFARILKKSIDSKIVVIFAGDDHARTDCDFLEKVLGAECLLRKKLDKKKWKQCLEITKEEWSEVKARSIY